MRKSLLIAALSAVLPLYMADETTAAAAPSEDPNAGASAAGGSQENGTTPSATTAPADAGTANEGAGEAVPLADGGAEGEAGNAASDAAASTGETASGAASTESPVLAEVPAADRAATVAGDTASLGTDANGTTIVPIPPAGDSVNVSLTDHVEAKDRFAGVLAKLHEFEDDSVEDLRAELLAIGTLLHLHSKAATDAALTGDYKASDL